METSAIPPPLAFTPEESSEANRVWGANCGPHSLAAALGASLGQVRQILVDFERRRWMNPTMIQDALRRAGVRYRLHTGLRTKSLCAGINRVQWEGPWLQPGLPPGAAYAHTHWIAQFNGWVLCTAVCRKTWVPVNDWAKVLSAENLPWHITHHYWLGLPATTALKQMRQPAS